MWTPVDITALPTTQDLINAQSAINEVESELKDALLELEKAQLRVNQIRQNLWERRAWIAPVRRLAPDVLSLVFEFCGEDSWQTPLRIAGVSRQWRDLALSTPRAWAFLDVHECLYDEDAELIDHFFKHSGQRPLHVYLTKSQDLTILSSVIERLECLSIRNDFQMRENPAFPRLKRLSLNDRGIAISDLEFTRFPALRELICKVLLGRDLTFALRSTKQAFPPLQVLSFATKTNTAWLDLLIGCKGSLVSLRIKLLDPFQAAGHLAFPLLKCLEIFLWSRDCDGWPVDLETPLLETYIESRHYWNGLKAPIHQDIGSVRQMRLDEALHFPAAPLLRTLQLDGYGDINIIMSRLESNRDLCPNLELIEAERRVLQAGYEDKLETINRQRSQPISLKEVKMPLRDLPFAVVTSPVSPPMRQYLLFLTITLLDYYLSVGHGCPVQLHKHVHHFRSGSLFLSEHPGSCIEDRISSGYLSFMTPGLVAPVDTGRRRP
jgi:hypothetical protein